MRKRGSTRLPQTECWLRDRHGFFQVVIQNAVVVLVDPVSDLAVASAPLGDRHQLADGQAAVKAEVFDEEGAETKLILRCVGLFARIEGEKEVVVDTNGCGTAGLGKCCIVVNLIDIHTDEVEGDFLETS